MYVVCGDIYNISYWYRFSPLLGQKWCNTSYDDFGIRPMIGIYVGIVIILLSFIPLSIATQNKRNLLYTIELNNYEDKLVAAGYSKKEILIELENYRRYKQTINTLDAINTSICINSLNHNRYR